MVVAYLYVEFTYGAHGFPEKPIVRTFGMKLMEARQDLNHVLILKLLDAYRALVNHKVVFLFAAAFITNFILILWL
jgi:hypothetical protein